MATRGSDDVELVRVEMTSRNARLLSVHLNHMSFVLRKEILMHVVRHTCAKKVIIIILSNIKVILRVGIPKIKCFDLLTSTFLAQSKVLAVSRCLSKGICYC